MLIKIINADSLVYTFMRIIVMQSCGVVMQIIKTHVRMCREYFFHLGTNFIEVGVSGKIGTGVGMSGKNWYWGRYVGVVFKFVRMPAYVHF